MTDELSTLSLGFIEELYEKYKKDPTSVSDQWRGYFAGLEQGPVPPASSSLRAALGRAQLVSGGQPGGELCARCARDEAMAALQHRVDQMIRNFRVRGHRQAALDPLGRPRWAPPELDPTFYGFESADMELEFFAGSLSPGGNLPLHEIIRRLRATYSESIGVQFMHIDDLAMRGWLQERMEHTLNRIQLSRKRQLKILERLTDAVLFERFVQKKFVGAKSFSLEGAESLIPLLDLAIEKSGSQGVVEIIIGMPHRGRLNVLANIMGKPPATIFREFEDIDAQLFVGRGDVKYHLGFHRDWLDEAGHKIHLALTFNPSHLEFVSPVAMGRLRAKQDRMGARDKGMLLLIHGDAAFAGEGIVQETLNLSRLAGYTVGGALHVVVNNQIGFTTPPEQGYSTVYPTDVAKMLDSPIFHVNGENPEAVAQVVELALDFRREFARDVFIDMWCFRRRGHSEGDEPSFTQPLMARAIKQRKAVRAAYLEHLLDLGEVSREEAEAIEERSRARLEQELANLHEEKVEVTRASSRSELGKIWARYRGGPDSAVPDVETSFDRARLSELLNRLSMIPEDFKPQAKIERLLDTRAQMARGERPIDWATAEMLAWASLAVEGTGIRLTGQDSERGTFSQRHAVLHDMQTGARFAPLVNLAGEKALVEIVNSPLSEGAVLGFEAGYAVACPDGLVIWEAQFGDFANAAQVYIDQFVATGEDKWRSLSGLVLLLPHGLEGTGPEHASARLERFLSLAAEDNLQIVYPTTPAQYFHCLRRQVLRPWRKPLVVMSPKSTLRHPQAISSLDQLAAGRFARVLPDQLPAQRPVSQVLICTGKVYYDLAKERDKRGAQDCAILRLEQLYPLSWTALKEALDSYQAGTPVVWVQEEPENMGALPHVRLSFAPQLAERGPFTWVCREASASPATGSAASHRLETQNLLQRAFETKND